MKAINTIIKDAKKSKNDKKLLDLLKKYLIY